MFHSIVGDAFECCDLLNAVATLPLQVTAFVQFLPILAVVGKPTSIGRLVLR